MSNWPQETEQFRQSLSHLLPPGFAFPRNPGSNVQRVIKAIAALFAEFKATADNTMLAKIPSELCCDDLNTWEELLGLPDECLGELDNCEQRQAAIISRLALHSFKYDDSSTASVGFLTSIAKSVGFAVNISVNYPFRFGRDKFNDTFGTNGILTIRVQTEVANTKLFNCDRFKFNQHKFGRKFGTTCRARILECLLNRIAPARYEINYIYER